MKDLLIGTSFAGDTPTQRKWLDIQLEFIRATTEDFDHISVMNGPAEEGFGDGQTQVIHPMHKDFGGSKAHQQALNILADVFERAKDNYRYFLILDCDAFPIREKWLRTLSDKMEEGGFEIATIVRPENCELRLHSSILFATKAALPNLNFVAKSIGYRLDGMIEKDLCMPYYEEHRSFALGMVRSNTYNVHPVGCGIYYDMFYHHTNGGDVPHIEQSKYYWNHMITPTENLFDFRSQLFEHPQEFINMLRRGPVRNQSQSPA